MASTVELVTRIALNDPLSFVLLVTGALLIGVSAGVFGILSLGAVLDFVTPGQ